MNFKLKWLLIIISLIAIPFFAQQARAQEKEEDRGVIFVEKGEQISGNLIAAAETVIINGSITGDLIVAANSINVNGRVEGDIIGLAQNINLEGEVGGNIRVIGNSIKINSSIARNLNAFGSDVVLGSDTRIGWDALIAGVNTNVGGQINGDLNAYSQSLFVSAKIGKNADLKIYNKDQNEGLTFTSDATINGDLNYSYKNFIGLDNKSVVSGEINSELIEVDERSPFASWIWKRLFSFLSIIFIGLIFVFLVPKYTKQLITLSKEKPGESLLWGIIFLLVIPVLSVLVALTIIGLPLALILTSLWALGIFAGKTLSAIILGSVIIRKLFKKNENHLFWPLLIGALILSLLFSIPLFGWVVNLLAIWLGWGVILLYVTNKSQNI